MSAEIENEEKGKEIRRVYVALNGPFQAETDVSMDRAFTRHVTVGHTIRTCHVMPIGMKTSKLSAVTDYHHVRLDLSLA